MTSFQSAFDRIKNAASTAGLDTQAPAAPAGDAFARIAKAVASVEPGAAPGGDAGEQDIMRTAAQQYEGDLLVQEADAKTARYFMFGLNPREIERGFRQSIEQTAQAVATPGLRAQFIESVLNPLFAVAAPWALPTAPMMGRLGAMATEPAGSGLTVDDLRTEQISARGAAMGRMAGAQEGVMGDISRALGQTAPQMLGVAAAVATGGGAAPIVAANLMGNANIPLSAWTAGQLEYFDEIDKKRAEEALSGQPLSTYSLDEMRKRATISAVAEAGPEIIGGAVAGKVIGGAAKAIIKTRAGRATVAALSERGRPLAEAVLASRAGQAGAEAFARASDGTLKFRNGFFGQAGKIIAASAVEEGAEELGSALIQAPFNEAPLSDDLKNGLYSAFIGSVAGGVGGVGAVGGAVAARGIQNRRDAFRPETNREIRLRQAHTDAMKARTNWSADLDESQQARVSIALNSLDGMAQEERGIFLRELADRRQDIANDVEAALALRQQLNDALAGARAAQQQFESGAPERAAKDALVKETEAALAKANADFEAAREMLAEAELATEATRSAVLREERQAQVEEARREVAAAKQRVDAAMSEATVAEGLEIAPGLRINPAEQIALLEQQIADIDAEMQMSVHDKMIADATYNAVREKVADMPMDYVQRTPQEVLSDIGSDQGTTLEPIAAPNNGARVTREMQALGLEVQWFRGKGKKFSSPGFFSMASRNTVFLNADYASGDIRATAMEELFHQIQMFRPEIAQAYSAAVGVAPIYEQGIRYSQRAAETSAKARLDEAALQQAGAAIAEIGGEQAAISESVRRAGAARLQQEGEANLFARTAGRLTRGGALQPFVRFAARRGLMGREVYAAMSVIDAVSRAAAIERVAGKKPSPTLSPLARTLLWAEDADIQLDRDIAEAERSEQPTAEAAKAPAAGVSMARASDDEYFAAIERGDMTAAQRMVDAAAKAAGYVYRVFHGTNAPPFDVFDMEMGGTKTGADSAQIGFFASDNQKVAQSYADNIGMGGAIDLALGGPLSAMRDKALETGRGKELKDAYLAAKSEYDAALKAGREQVRADVANSDVIARLKDAGFENEINGFIDSLSTAEIMNGDWLQSTAIVAAEAKLTEVQEPLAEFVNDVLVSSLPNRRVLNLYAKMENPAIYDAEGKTPAEFSLTPKIQKAIRDGNDGVIFRNLIDPVEPSTHYVVFKSSQFKSADPVTRDEAGNIIPLSKRFDVFRPEISFARPEEDAEIQSLREQVAELKRQIRDVQNVTAAQRVNAMREVRVLERRIVTAERLAEQKTLQATRAKARVELEKQARDEDKVAADAAIAKMETRLDAAIASVKSMRADIASLRRTARNTEQEIADAEATAQRAIDWAYAIGRNAGRMAGEIRGQQVKQREVKALTKRLEFVEPRLQQAREALREARKDIKADAAAAQRAIDFAYGMGLAKGRLQGVMEGRRQVLARMAKREDALQNQMFNLRRMMQARADQAEEVRDAAQSIARDAASTLPVALRGPLAVRIAGVKTLAQANRIAVEAVKLAANSEVDKSVDAIRSLRKAMKKRGMRISTRTRIEQMLDQAEAGLRTASGRKIRAAVTPAKGPKAVMAGPALVNAVDIYAAVVDAATLVEQAALLHAADRQAFLQMRAARIARYDALRQGLAQAMTGRPTLQERERADQPPRASLANMVGRANSDIYTLMLELEGTEAGVINDLLTAAQAGKGEASLEHASILRQLAPALQAAGYESIDQYALVNGLLGEASTQTRDVVLGGQNVTLPIGTIMSLAAMDDETLALFPDALTPGSQQVKFAGAASTKSYSPTKGEIRALLAGLSRGERDLIAAMKNILETQIRDRVMDAVYSVEGDQPPIVQNYWPRVREAVMQADAAAVLQTAGMLVRGALTSVGFAQARTGGRQPLIYRDAFQTWERHVQVALDMIHMAQPYRDAATVLTDPEVVRLMDTQMGDGTARRVLAIFSNGVGATARSNPTIIDKLTNNVTGAVLAMNPRTLAKVVVGGQIRLASEIPAGYWARGVARAARQTVNPRAWDARVEEIHSLNGYFSRRHQLHMRSIVSGSLSDADRVRVTTAFRSMAESFRSAGQNLVALNLTDAAGAFRDASNGANMMIASVVDALRYMDEQIMLAAVEARLAEVEDEGILTGQNALREAALRAERDFRRTQNASDEFDDTAFAAYNRVQGTQGWRLLFPFSSDPLKARNQIRRAYLSGNNRLATGLAIGGNMASSTIIGALSLTTAGYMASLVAGLLGGGEPSDEDDKKFREEAKYIPANVAAEALSSSLGYSGIVMSNVVQSYVNRRSAFAPIAVRPIEQVGREVTAMTAEDGSMLRIIPALLALSQFAGFPAYQLYKFIEKQVPKDETTSGGRKPSEPKTERQKILDRIERRRREIEKLRQGG